MGHVSFSDSEYDYSCLAYQIQSMITLLLCNLSKGHSDDCKFHKHILFGKLGQIVSHQGKDSSGFTLMIHVWQLLMLKKLRSSMLAKKVPICYSIAGKVCCGLLQVSRKYFTLNVCAWLRVSVLQLIYYYFFNGCIIASPPNFLHILIGFSDKC